MKKIALATLLISGLLFAQNSAVSSHTLFTHSGRGTVQVSEVRVPADGVAKNTYYETIGWWSDEHKYGQGYAGIQESGDIEGNKVHIFSMWDEPNTNIVEYLAYGMVDSRFAGEGTGSKSWCITSDTSHVLYWQPDVWYTHVIKCWPLEGRTHYGFFVRDGESGVWRHLSTISVDKENLLLRGISGYDAGDFNNDAFIEDWLATGENKREVHLRNQWRLLENGTWDLATNARYYVNDWDFGESYKRSYNYRTNWDGGVREDSTGDYSYNYMTTGGAETSPTPPLSYTDKVFRHTFKAQSTTTTFDYGKAVINELNIEKIDDSQIKFTWIMDSLTVPQASYTLEILDEEQNLTTFTSDVPQTREYILNITAMDMMTKSYSVSFTVEDIFGNTSEVKTATIGNGVYPDFITLLTPDGNSEYTVGDVVNFTWTDNLDAPVFLYLTENDVEPMSIAEVAGDVQSYKWTIPESYTGDYGVRLVCGDETYDIAGTITIKEQDANYLPVSNSDLTVHLFSTELNQTTGWSENVIDGDISTYWQTEFMISSGEIVLKSEEALLFTSLKYTALQGSGVGRVNEYKIYVSEDSLTWGTPVASGNLLNHGTEQQISFEPTYGQYVKFKAVSAINNAMLIAIAELGLTHKIPESAISTTNPVAPVQSMISSVVHNRVSLNLTRGVNYSFSIYSVNGRLIQQKSIIGSGITGVDLPAVARGVYMMEIIGLNQREMRSFIPH